MNGALLRRPSFSEGEKKVLIGQGMTGVFGALLAMVVVIRLDGSAFFERPITAYEWWIIAAGFIGGWFGTALAKGRLGRPGLINLLLGMGIVTVAAPIIAGTLGLPLYGTMFGPFTLALILYASPITAGLWVANLIGVHVLNRTWHAERDSIFGAQPPEPVLQMIRRTALRIVQRA